MRIAASIAGAILAMAPLPNIDPGLWLDRMCVDGPLELRLEYKDRPGNQLGSFTATVRNVGEEPVVVPVWWTGLVNIPPREWRLETLNGDGTPIEPWTLVCGNGLIEPGASLQVLSPGEEVVVFAPDLWNWPLILPGRYLRVEIDLRKVHEPYSSVRWQWPYYMDADKRESMEEKLAGVPHVVLRAVVPMKQDREGFAESLNWFDR